MRKKSRRKPSGGSAKLLGKKAQTKVVPTFSTPGKMRATRSSEDITARVASAKKCPKGNPPKQRSISPGPTRRRAGPQTIVPKPTTYLGSTHMVKIPEDEAGRGAMLNDTVLNFIKEYGAYTNKLGYLLKFYVQPLRSQKAHLVSSSDHKMLFRALEDLAVTSRALYLKLKERGRGLFEVPPVPPRFGDVYLKLASRLYIYCDYAYQYADILALHQRLIETKSDYETFMLSTWTRIIEETSHKNMPKFEKLLMLPLNRLSYHTVFLERLVQLTPKSERGYDALATANAEISGIVEFSEACFSKSEDVMRLVGLDESLKGPKKPTRMLSPKRAIVRDGVLKRIIEFGGKKEKLRVVILSDVILIAEVPSAAIAKKQRCIVRHAWAAAHIQAIDMEDSVKSPSQRFPGKNKFKLRFQEETKSTKPSDLVFSCEDKEVKLSWMKDLKTVLAGTTVKTTTAHFLSIVTHSKGYHLFLEFLKSEYSDENLLFWKAVRTWKAKYSRTHDSHGKAMMVYDTFVRKGSEREINLPNEHFKGLKALFEDGVGATTPETFDSAQNNIFRMMEMDSYKRFIKTEGYSSLIREVVEHRKDKARKAMMQNIGM